MRSGNKSWVYNTPLDIRREYTSVRPNTFLAPMRCRAELHVLPELMDQKYGRNSYFAASLEERLAKVPHIPNIPHRWCQFKAFTIEVFLTIRETRSDAETGHFWTT